MHDAGTVWARKGEDVGGGHGAKAGKTRSAACAPSIARLAVDQSLIVKTPFFATDKLSHLSACRSICPLN
jgi:hypothetical protein